jgi:hypothetical protein
MKQLKQMEAEFKETLQEIASGIVYGHYLQTECGGEITRGEHIDIRVPEGVQFNSKQVVAAFNMYYTDVTWDGNVHHHCVNNEDVQEMVLDVDSDPRNEELREKREAVEA